MKKKETIIIGTQVVVRETRDLVCDCGAILGTVFFDDQPNKTEKEWTRALSGHECEDCAFQKRPDLFNDRPDLIKKHKEKKHGII